jgi:transposase
MAYWSKAPIDREQIALFAPTLDSWIPPEHPVRIFDEVLSALDWSSWQARYCGCNGQPPIDPRIMAAVILYGLSLGMRSSRTLERACANSIDFLWLSSGRTIDHSTICSFRIRFGKELKDVFKQMGRLCMSMGLIKLNQVGLDGTRIKANNGPHQKATAQSLEQRLAALDEQIEQVFSEARAACARYQDLFVSDPSSGLPQELTNLQKRKEALEKALSAAEQIERRRRRRPKAPSSAPEVPVTDTDCAVLPNKEGGYAANYTPMAAIDSHRGFIVDADVDNKGYESHTTIPAVDRIKENFDRSPDQLLADSAHGTGSNFQGLEDRAVEAYIPAQNCPQEPNNPAQREDPTKPVPQEDWDKLPRNRQSKKLDHSAFIYDASDDCYYCPMGRRLTYIYDFNRDNRDGPILGRVYRSQDCSGCALAKRCLISKSNPRTVHADIFEAAGRKALERLSSPEGQELYRHRTWICETPFAIIKAHMRVRQFLLRGHEKVKTEWLWICTSYNLSKLVRQLVRMRVRFCTVLV